MSTKLIYPTKNTHKGVKTFHELKMEDKWCCNLLVVTFSFTV